jgi:hypothetical protein
MFLGVYRGIGVSSISQQIGHCVYSSLMTWSTSASLALRGARFKHSATNLIYGFWRGGTDPNTNRLLHLARPPVLGWVFFLHREFDQHQSGGPAASVLLHCALRGCRRMAMAELK